MYATLLIPESNVAPLMSIVERLARRIKSGKTEASFIPTATVVKSQTMLKRGKRTPQFYHGGRIDPINEVLVEWHWVTVHYERPSFSGWSLLGVYDWADGYCVFSPIPGESAPRALWDVEANRCDHCHVRHQRTKGMLIRHEDGTHMVVGSACLKDFLGHISAETLTAIMKFERSLETMQEDDEDAYGSSMPYVYGVHQALAAAAMLVEQNGYVKATDEGPATKYTVMTYMRPYTFEEKEFVANNPLGEKHYQKATDIIEWSKTLNDSNEYTYTLKNILNAESGVCTGKRMGILVSAVVVYDRAMSEKVEVESNATVNEYVGVIKERLKGLPLTVQKAIHGFNDFGNTTMLIMADVDGRKFVWYASRSVEVEIGDAITIDGTVKDHREYKGIKQTILTRVKIK